MNSAAENIANDLAYVRTLAEEGRDAPLVGGRLYAIWGGLMGLTALLNYLDDIAVIGGGVFTGLAPWLAATAIGWVLSFTVGRRAVSKPGGRTLGNRTARSAWFAVGVFVMLFWGTLMFTHGNYTHLGVPPYFLFGLMFPVAFGLYSVAFYATATASRLLWLRWFAALSCIFSVICLTLLGSVHQLLFGALGSFLCAALPGVLLMRVEPSDIV